MNLWDLAEAFNNLHAAITKSILLSSWEIQVCANFSINFHLAHLLPPSIHPPFIEDDWIGEKMKRKEWFEKLLEWNGCSYLKKHWNMIRKLIERRRHQNWCRNYDVKQVLASGIGNGTQRRRKALVWEKNHSFRSECSVRCFGCAFLLCADFIDYMKRIQIAAQECNIRFLNPIVGMPEKRAPQCGGYIHNIL